MGALWELARRSRGTPRVANRLLRRARDFAAVEGKGKLTLPITKQALELAAIDEIGLDEQDRAFLRTLIDVYDGGPCGIEAIAATMGEERDTLEDVIEPYSAADKRAGNAHAARSARDEARVRAPRFEVEAAAGKERRIAAV